MSNPSFVQGATGVLAAAALSVAYGSNNTAHNLLIAVVRCNSDLATVTVTDTQGNYWTQLENQAATGASLSQLWYALDCSAGANTVTAWDTASYTSALELLIGEYQSGTVGQILTLDTHASTSGSSGTPASGNAPTYYNNDLLFGWTNNNVGSPITAGLIGGGTASLREDQSDVAAYEDNNAANNTAGTIAATFGGSQAGYWACGIAAFNVGGTSFYQSASQKDNGPSAVSNYVLAFPRPCKLGDLLFVSAMWDNGNAAPPSISDTDGNLWTQLPFVNGSATRYITCFYCLAAKYTGSINTVTVSWGSANSLYGNLCLEEWTPSAGHIFVLDVYASSSSGSGGGSSSGTPVTTNYNGDIVIGCGGSGYSQYPTPDSVWNVRSIVVPVRAANITEDTIQATAGTITPNLNTSAEYATFTVAFASIPSAAPSGVTNSLMMMGLGI